MLVRGSRANGAFTLLELLIAIAVIAILTLLVIGAVSGLRSRARRAQCMANLTALYAGCELYRQQHDQWPQIVADTSTPEGSQDYAQQWISALEPFGVTRKTWICPEIQDLVGNPDYNQPENVRIDYIPMPFDDKPMTPHQWSRQPWFIERGDVHGNGNLIIFTDGSISDLSAFKSTNSGK